MSTDTSSIPGSLILFPASDGVRLQGFLQSPPKRARSAVIFVHGMGGFFWSAVGSATASAALHSGFAFFAFNNRGAGWMRRVHAPRKKVNGGTAHERFEECVYDIKGAIKTLKKTGYRDFVLVGHSTGCQKITYYLAKTKDRAVRSLVLLAPGDDLNLEKTSLGKKFGIALTLAKKMIVSGRGHELMPSPYKPFSAKRYYGLFKETSTEGNLFNYAGKLKLLKKVHVPSLAVFGKDETKTQYTPGQMLDKLRQANPFVVTRLIPGDHSFSRGERKLGRVINMWLSSLISSGNKP